MKLIPVIAQDARTNDVLMMAWADPHALKMTRKTGYMHYWSRSRQKLWKKGEESGHVQKVVSLHYDCDRDTILARVIQTGPACHRNTATCWFAKPPRARWTIGELWDVFKERRKNPLRKSYTNALLNDPAHLHRKLLEETCELIMAVRSRRKDRVAEEAADVLYHYLLTLFAAGVKFDAVEEALERRKAKPKAKGTRQ